MTHRKQRRVRQENCPPGVAQSQGSHHTGETVSESPQGPTLLPLLLRRSQQTPLLGSPDQHRELHGSLGTAPFRCTWSPGSLGSPGILAPVAAGSAMGKASLPHMPAGKEPNPWSWAVTDCKLCLYCILQDKAHWPGVLVSPLQPQLSSWAGSSPALPWDRAPTGRGSLPFLFLYNPPSCCSQAPECVQWLGTLPDPQQSCLMEKEQDCVPCRSPPLLLLTRQGLRTWDFSDPCLGSQNGSSSALSWG